MSEPRMLRVAVPNKGALAEAARDMLISAGYRQRSDLKELTLIDADHNVEFYYLRPRDIAVYVGRGDLDVGITGRDMLLDSGADAQETMELGFGASRFRFAAPVGSGIDETKLDGLRIATSYAGLLRRYLEEHGIRADIVSLDGAVESAIRLGVAEAVADVVDTGTTLRKAGLAMFGEPILVSEAVLVQRNGDAEGAATDALKTRLNSVMVAQNYLMMDYNVEATNLDATVGIAPGVEGPTVSALAKDGWLAVRALVPRKGAHRLMDRMYDAGARGILLTELAACRL
ncbi:MAG: ATP phosphoribosyltransferase [Propionibacterium sp.]|nr:ATP phosphoribosyltransferase [Propionibacterium sp.]